MNGTPEYTPGSVFPTLPRTTRGMPLVLGGDPKGKNFLYCNGTSVIIRDIDNPSICDVYTEHSTLTTVAKYAPSGFYIASGDQSGKVRIWDTTQKEHILKKEYQPISGAIRDIAWSPDSQRIAVVGEGREKFGHVFLFDTGTSNGSLSGQSKTMNSIDFRPERPFRLVSASEDNTVAIFEGPPFKFKSFFQNHTRFAHTVRYQPGGKIFASCGADGKIFVFDGVEGTPQGEFVDEACKGSAHSGGVYAISWSPDGSRLLSASGDKTCKIWDANTYTLLTTFKMGDTIEDQQLSCLWQGNHLISVGLSGFITYLDPENPQKPLRVVKGHNKPITSLSVDPEKGKMFTSDMEGHITRWDTSSGENERLNPRIHKSQVQTTVLTGDTLTSVGMDDTLAKTTGVLKDDIKSLNPTLMKLNTQPRGVGVSPDGELTAVACQKEIILMKKEHKVGQIGINYEPNGVDVNPKKTMVAVAGQDSKVHVYEVKGDSLAELKELNHNGIVTAVKFSPDGSILAATDAARKVIPYKTDSWTSASSKEWTFHTAKVNCVAFSPNGRHLATGSLDTNIIVWDLQQSGEHPIIIKGAHQMNQITDIAWLGPNKIVSVGQDSNTKQWDIHL